MKISITLIIHLKLFLSPNCLINLELRKLLSILVIHNILLSKKLLKNWVGQYREKKGLGIGMSGGLIDKLTQIRYLE